MTAAKAEQSPSSPELASPQDLYDVCQQILLEQGKWSGDAHYLRLEINVSHIPGHTAPTPGLLRLYDYHTYNSRQVDELGPNLGLSCPHPDLYRPILASGHAILGMQFYALGNDGKYNLPGAWYSIFRPADAIPGSSSSYFIYDEEEFPAPAPLGDRDPNQILILRGLSGTEDYAIIDDPKQDPQLAEVHLSISPLLNTRSVMAPHKSHDGDATSTSEDSGLAELGAGVLAVIDRLSSANEIAASTRTTLRAAQTAIRQALEGPGTNEAWYRALIAADRCTVESNACLQAAIGCLTTYLKGIGFEIDKTRT